MGEDDKTSKPKWKVYTGTQAPDLRKEIANAFDNREELPKVSAALVKKYPLAPFSWFNKGEALDGRMLIPGVMNKLEARKRDYVIIIEGIGETSARIGVYTPSVGYKARIPSRSRVVLERIF